jgi:hypothetical protein
MNHSTPSAPLCMTRPSSLLASTKYTSWKTGMRKFSDKLEFCSSPLRFSDGDGDFFDGDVDFIHGTVTSGEGFDGVVLGGWRWERVDTVVKIGGISQASPFPR